MREQDNLIKYYNLLMDAEISPFDIYLLDQVMTSDSCFGISDSEALEMIAKIKTSIESDYQREHGLEEHINSVIYNGGEISLDDLGDELIW